MRLKTNQKNTSIKPSVLSTAHYPTTTFKAPAAAGDKRSASYLPPHLGQMMIMKAMAQTSHLGACRFYRILIKKNNSKKTVTHIFTFKKNDLMFY